MAANFPNNPSVGDTFTSNGVTFTWDGSAWKLNSSSGTKGDKGTSGSDGSDGDKGQKGEVGATGSAGSDGSDGDKGQKGDTGSSGTDAQLPVGTIVAYGGVSAPTGWQVCNGGTPATSALQTLLGSGNNVPDLRDRFIIGAAGAYGRNDTGGYTDVFIPEHTHTYSGTASNTNLGSHKHGSGNYSAGSAGSHVHNMTIGNGSDDNDSDNRRIRSYFPSQNDLTFSGGIQSGGSHSHSVSGDSSNKDLGSHNHTYSGTTANNTGGAAITNAQRSGRNLPPYYALYYIIKT